jgi:hypothetical protein
MAIRTLKSTFNSRVDSLLQGISDTTLPPLDRDAAIEEAIQEYNNDAPRRTVVEFAGDAGAYYLLFGKTVNVAESNRDAGIDLTDAAAGADQKLAIAFTLARTLTIRSFAFYLRRTGATVAGELTGEIFTDASDLPDALVATAKQVDIDGDAGAPENRDAKVHFNLADPVTLAAGTYHAALGSASDYDHVDGTTEVIVGVQQAGSPTNTVSTYNGSVWAAFGTDSAGVLEVTAATPGWRSLLGQPLDVEYPAALISGDEAPNQLEDDEWETYNTEEGLWLHFPTYRPASTETVRVSISEPYEWQRGGTPSIDTPVEHFEALSYLAASLCCERVASKFGQKRSPTLNADVADRSQQGTFYRTQAKTYRAYYNRTLGIGKEAMQIPSATVVDVDAQPPYGGGDYMFHQKRGR